MTVWEHDAILPRWESNPDLTLRVQWLFPLSYEAHASVLLPLTLSLSSAMPLWVAQTYSRGIATFNHKSMIRLTRVFVKGLLLSESRKLLYEVVYRAVFGEFSRSIRLQNDDLRAEYPDSDYQFFWGD